MRPLVLMGHERPLTQVKYNKEGDLLFTCSKDSSASIWYTINGERLGTLDGHAGTIWSIDVDPLTMYCVTGSADYSIKIWNVSNGENVFTYQSPVPVKCVEFSPCGNYFLAILDSVMGYPGSINVYKLERDSTTKEITNFIEEPIQTINTQEGLVTATVAGWSTNGKFIIAGHKDGNISKYDVENNYQFVTSFKLHESNISDLQFSPDRTYFITSSRDSNARIVDVASFKVLKTYETDCPLNTASITPLKEFVVLGGGQSAKDVTTTSASEGKFEARFYHKIFEEEIGRVKGHFGPLNTIAVSPTGTSYTSGGEDGLVRLHHFEKSYFDFKYDVEKAFEAKEHMQEAN
ncbi:eukaryotic translation initiation factor 3 subunit I [Monosporozyma servazzii]